MGRGGERTGIRLPLSVAPTGPSGWVERYGSYWLLYVADDVVVAQPAEDGVEYADEPACVLTAQRCVLHGDTCPRYQELGNYLTRSRARGTTTYVGQHDPAGLTRALEEGGTIPLVPETGHPTPLEGAHLLVMGDYDDNDGAYYGVFLRGPRYEVMLVTLAQGCRLHADDHEELLPDCGHRELFALVR